MSQKTIFERIYNIVLLRGSESAINSLNSMYNSFIKENVSKAEIENATYLKNELIDIFLEAQEYKESISVRGMSEVDRNFFEKQRVSTDNLKQDLTIVEKEDTIFYDKRVVITGVFSRYADRNELALTLKKLGADLNSSISKKTEIVCLGWDGVGPAKMAKIADLKAAGFEIMLIEEHQLYHILDSI